MSQELLNFVRKGFIALMLLVDGIVREAHRIAVPSTRTFSRGQLMIDVEGFPFFF
jgi:hypothetical protein